MRNFARLALSGLVFATLASAQSLILGTGGVNTGNVSGGIYWDLTVNTTVTFNTINYAAKNDAAGTHQSSFNIYVGPSTWVGNVGANPGPWTLVAATTPQPLTGGTGVQGSGPVQILLGTLNPAGPNPGPFTLPPGNYGIAMQAVNHAWSYTTGAGTFSDANMTATTGGASNVWLALPTFTPRTFNGTINYTLGGTPMPFARRSPYGAGCYANYRSIYELFPNAVGFDLSNTSMLWTLDASNNRWSSITAGTTPVQPVTSTSLGHLDDNNITINLANGQPILFPNIGGLGIATTTVEMCSNGYVNLLGTTPATGNPTVGAWITGTSARIGLHYNMNPPGGGGTHYDYDAVNSAHVFSWLAVATTGFTGVNTFQMAFFANGNVEFRWGAMSGAGGGSRPTLVGFSPGGASLDPGTIDWTTALPTSTAGFDQAPLAVTASTNPVLGSVVSLTTSNVTGVNLGLCFVSLSDLPPFSPVGFDLGVIGAPGCVANIDINQGVGNLISNLGTPFPGLTIAFTIPTGPISLLGASFFVQSAWLDATQNPGGILTSNAIELKIGAF